MANVGEVVTILTESIPFRREFHLAMKESRETPNAWLARVKTLAELCGFGQCQDLCVLDKFLAGFDTETINHLCSSAEQLDIATALEVTEAYSMRTKRKCAKKVTTVHVKEEQANQKVGEFVDCKEPVISDVLEVKCEDNANDDENAECSDENDFSNDNIFDDGAASDSSSSTSDSNNDDHDKDSDFHPSDFDSKAKKEAARVKRKYVKKADKEAVKVEATTIADQNAPKKKRKYNYKPRAIKPKETFECDICHYKNSHKCHLIRHMMIHSNQKSFVCHKCGKAFNLLIGLNAHLYRHAGYKPHVCEVCKASFLEKPKLKIHMRTHTGERPFGCTMCDKRFSEKYSMKIHMRSHTGEKPFKCDKCLHTFAQSSSLSLHKRKSCHSLL